MDVIVPGFFGILLIIVVAEWICSLCGIIRSRIEDAIREYWWAIAILAVVLFVIL